MLDGKLVLSDGEDSEQIDSDFERENRTSLSKNIPSEYLKSGYLRKRAQHRKVYLLIELEKEMVRFKTEADFLL